MKRIQRQRTKGWRVPEGAVYVGGPSKWGNPFHPGWSWSLAASAALGGRADDDGARRAVVVLYRWWLTGVVPVSGDWANRYRIHLTEGSAGGLAWLEGTGVIDLPLRLGWPDLTPLAGHDLACWCPLDQPCHADVLLELVS